MSDFLDNKLKNLSAGQLETIIAKAISEATGETYEADISKIDFGMLDASFKIKVSLKSEFTAK